MNRRKFNKIFGAGLGLGTFPQFALAQDAISGGFFAALEIGQMVLNLKLDFVSKNEVFLYSIDQGNAKIPASKIKIDGNKFSLFFNSIKASIDGEFGNEELNTIFKQGNLVQALKFVRNAPQKPKKKEYSALSLEGLKKLRNESGAPAMIAAAANASIPAKIYVDGMREINVANPAQTNDNWHIGSISKSFTALLVAIFVERGKISWTTKLSEILGENFPMRKEYKNVTLLHLLSHRAGLAENINIIKFLTFKRVNPDPRAERLEFVKTALKMPPIGKMGETFLYSNNGFVIAGYILEKISGKSWEELMRKEVFEPLGLDSAGFGAPGEVGKNDAPFGHSASGIGKPLKPAVVGKNIGDNPAVMGPAGTINISAPDMIKYSLARALRHEILNAKSWEILETPPFGGEYALGILKRDDGYFWHNGSNTLWYAEFAYNPATKRMGFAACNSGAVATVSKVNDALFGALAGV